MTRTDPRRLGLALAVIGVLVGPVGGGRAFAQGEEEESAAEAGRVRVGVFFVGTSPLPSDLHARLQRALERALEQNRNLGVRDKDLLFAEFAAEIPGDAVAEARALLKSGRDLLADGRAAEALLKLSGAEGALENVLAFVKKNELADAQFLRGAAELRVGDRRAARATFARLQVWRPDFVLDVERFPGVLPLWEEAKRQVAKAGVGSVQIASEPDGAMAYIDGRYLGTTPVTAGSLTAGDHYVTLKAEGYRRRVVRVTVDPRFDELVSESLPKSEKAHLIVDLLEKARPSLGQDVAPQPLVDLSGFLGLEQVVVGRVAREGGAVRLDAWLYDLRSRRRLSQATGVRVPAGAEEPRLAELARTLYLNVRYDGKTEADLRAAAPRPAPAPARPRGPAFYTRWWFWTIVGGVAVASAAPFVVEALTSGPSCPADHTCTELVWRF